MNLLPPRRSGASRGYAGGRERAIVNFLDLLLFYLYDLPKQIETYRQRKNPPTASSP